MNDEPTADTVEGCVLFTDLVGFTAFNEAVGDAAAVDVLDRQSALVREVLDEGGDARIVKELGDGLMIWFGSAAKGLDRAVALVGSVTRARREERFPLAVRMGMHHGEAVERGGDLVGHTVNVAARVCELAGPGELLVSERVVDACDEVPVDLVQIGPTTVRGVSGAIWLHRVVC